MNEGLLFMLIGIPNVEHLREILSQVMRGCTLNAATTHRHIQLDRGRVFSSRKSFILTLASLDYWNGEQLVVDSLVVVQNGTNERVGFCVRGVGGMSLLPEELACANKWRGVLELPTHNVSPLVEQERQVTVRVNPLAERRIHNGLAGWADSNGLGKVALATLGDPGDFGREALEMLFLLHKGGLGHEHREVAVLDAEFLDACVEERSDLFPNVEGGWAQDVAARDFVVFDQLGLGDDLRVPL